MYLAVGQLESSLSELGNIYSSSSGGTSWSTTQAPPSPNWVSIASDSTGMYLAAAQYPGGIYVSTSGGSGVWNLTSAPSGYWYCIASDGTGKYLAAGQGGYLVQGYIYTSTSGYQYHHFFYNSSNSSLQEETVFGVEHQPQKLTGDLYRHLSRGYSW